MRIKDCNIFLLSSTKELTNIEIISERRGLGFFDVHCGKKILLFPKFFKILATNESAFSEILHQIESTTGPFKKQTFDHSTFTDPKLSPIL
jgi:hypothetical protein